MKRLITLTLALIMAVTLAACNAPTAENGGDNSATAADVTTSAPAADIDKTADNATLANAEIPATEKDKLPEGYKLEIEQTGEKSGIIRLTDPNMQENYPTYDSSVELDYALFMWNVNLTDDYRFNVAIWNTDPSLGDEPQTSLSWQYFQIYNGSDYITSLPQQIDGKTMIWEFALDNTDFNWADVTDCEVRIEDVINNVYIDVSVPLSEAATGSSSPAATADNQTDIPTYNVMDALQAAGGAEPEDAEYFDESESEYIGYVTVQMSSSGEIDAPIWENGVKTERVIPYHFMRYTTYSFKNDGTVETVIITKFDEAFQAEHYYSGGMTGTLNGSRHYEKLPSYSVNSAQAEAERLISMAERDNFLVFTSFIIN